LNMGQSPSSFAPSAGNLAPAFDMTRFSHDSLEWVLNVPVSSRS